jgi:virginiamycin B lyase
MHQRPAVPERREYPVNSAAAFPLWITAGPNHSMWFTEEGGIGSGGAGGNKIGQISVLNHHVTEYPVPTSNSAPTGITSGRNQTLWFTENSANQIGELDARSHAFQEWPIPTPDSQPYIDVFGSDGGLWFTEYAAGKIGRFDTRTHTFREYTIPTADSLPVVITPGRHRDLWFGESGTGNKIGRITTGGRITEYPGPSPNAGLSGIALDRQGDVWTTEELTGKIARLDPRSGAVTEFPLPTGYLATGLTAFAGRLWFNAVGPQASIGTIDDDGNVTLYPVPTASSISIGITGGPDHALWFAEAVGDNIGRAGLR